MTEPPPTTPIYLGLMRLHDEIDRLAADVRVQLIQAAPAAVEAHCAWVGYVRPLLARPVGDALATAMTAVVAMLYATSGEDREALIEAGMTAAGDPDGPARDFWIAFVAVVGEVHRRRAAITAATVPSNTNGERP